MRRRTRLCHGFNLHFNGAHLISLKQDLLNKKPDLEATFEEAEVAARSVELLLPIIKDTVEEIGNCLPSLLEKLTDHENENAVSLFILCCLFQHFLFVHWLVL